MNSCVITEVTFGFGVTCPSDDTTPVRYNRPT